MNELVIANTAIRKDADGRYCINDLHRAAGGERKHEPANWLANQQTKDLIEELTDTEIPVSVSRGGLGQGTFVCKELVYSYAMWINARFNLQVIRAFDAMVNAPQPAIPSWGEALVLAGNAQIEVERLALANKEQQELIEYQAPMVESYKEFMDSNGNFSMMSVGKIVDIGGIILYELLRHKKVLMGIDLSPTHPRRNVPYQPYMDAGYFKMIPSAKFGGEVLTTFVTPKGLVWIIKKIKEWGIITSGKNKINTDNACNY